MRPRKRKFIYEARFKIRSRRPGVAELLRGVLTSLGIPQSAIVDLKKNKHVYVCVYFQRRAQLNALRRQLGRLDLKRVTLEVRPLDTKDWRDRWRTNLKPFSLGKQFVVVPLWLRNKYHTKIRRPVYIDAVLAFGSGLHETTRFMVQLIESRQGHFQSFFDIGTGTGILSVVARRCGGRDVDAMDFNPDCVATARRNLRANAIKVRRLEVADIHKYKKKDTYDFVAANLVTHNLLHAGRRIVGAVKPGKYLAVSGVSLENFNRFQKTFRRYPLRCLKIIKGKAWAAFLYKKKGGR